MWFLEWKSRVLRIERGNISSISKKGNIGKPNKWKRNQSNGRLLQFLSIMLTDRLYILVEKHGTKHQFGSTPRKGCQDGSFTLTSVLHRRMQHNLLIFALFVDVIKAYDTSDHKHLIQLIWKYEAPPKIIYVIQRLYTDLKIVINIGNKGNPMVSLSRYRLFIYVEQFLVETYWYVYLNELFWAGDPEIKIRKKYF